MNSLLLAFASPLLHAGVAVNMNNLGARALSPLADGIPLRIMPLGASITWGQASSDGNGYRAELRSQLVAGGNAVNMVGSRRHGTGHDNDVEAWPGFVIEAVHLKAQTSVLHWKPSVVLINAGTNDCLQSKRIAQAGDRMETLIHTVLDASPQAVVLLSSLLVNRNVTVDARAREVNAQFAALVTKMQGQGKHVVFVDMRDVNGPQLADLADSTHPGDTGYQKMASLWYEGLVQASNAGWLVKPDPVAGVLDDGSI